MSGRDGPPAGLPFEVWAAFVVGALLPMLETFRRGLGFWVVDVTTMLEDYVAGALLLVAAVAAQRGAAFAPALLLTAWAAVTSMMSVSVWDQVETAVRGVDLEPGHGMVLCVKLLLWATCLAALVRSFRAVLRRASDRGGVGPL